MREKPKVLLTVASFARDYGGPALSVSRLGVAISQQGVDVGLWAPDGSALMADPGILIGDVKCFDGDIVDVIEKFGPSLIHDNGIWLPYNHTIAKICFRLDTPRIVSVRGMLEPWARRYKRYKKIAAWFAYQRRDLSGSTYIHATSKEEAKSISDLDLKVPVSIIPNGMDVLKRIGDSEYKSCGKAGTKRTALFLSRVHPKKGLPMLIDSWAVLRPKGWRLIIAGPDEMGHSDEIRARINQNDLQDEILLVGPKYEFEKETLFKEADLFVLPSHSENFGLVVAEALAFGLPVLTTKGTPWSELIIHSCGWWVNPTKEEIEIALQEALGTKKAKLVEMGARGQKLIERKYSWEHVGEKMKELYFYILAQDKPIMWKEIE